MRFYHDQSKVDEIVKKLYDKFMEEAEDRTKVHLSDTTRCPLKCYYRLINMPGFDFDEASVGFMSIGIVGQELIQQLYPDGECEYENDEWVPSHVDIFEDCKYPIEIKFSGRTITRADDVPKYWTLQLMRYLAIHNAPYGWMLIMNTSTRRFSAFKMYMEPEEKEYQLAFIEDIRDTIYEARDIYSEFTGPLSPEYTNFLKAIRLLSRLLEPEEFRYDECKYCDYRPGRKRKKEGLLGEGCPMYASKPRS